MAERSPDVSCAIKSGNEQLARSPNNDKKELSKSTSTGWATGLCGQHRKRAAQTAQGRFRSTRRHDAGHVLVCSKHFWREFESAGDASLLRLRPANWMWSHCSQCHVCSEGLKPKDAGMTLIEPWRKVGHWFCDSNRNDKSATFWPHAAVSVTTRAPQWRNTRSGPRNAGIAKAASSGEIRQSPETPEGASRPTALLKLPVSTTAPGFTQRSRMSSNNAMQTDRRWAHSLLKWALATVK